MKQRIIKQYKDPDIALNLTRPDLIQPIVPDNSEPDENRASQCPLAECAKKGSCIDWYRCECNP